MMIDTSSCCDAHANEAVDDLFAKASRDGADIWRQHESVLVRHMIELFTDRGLTRIGSLQIELQKWLDGSMYRKGDRPATPPGYIEHWTDGELALVRLYLETLPPAEFTIDDWMLAVDWLGQRYFPADQLRLEAEWLAVKASAMGRVQARMGVIAAEQADKLLAASPVSVAAVSERFGMSAAQEAMMTYGRARCFESVRTMAAGLVHRAKSVVMDFVKGKALGDKAIQESLETRLGDAFGQANVDFRRIALTEAGELANQGFIASLEPGARVRRLEQYVGACSFCRKIDGMEFEVVDPATPNKDGWTQVWVGKTNEGRSAAPRKRVEGELIDRDDDELWWPTAGTIHPNCRGVLISVKEPDRAGDPEFTKWLEETLEKA